MARKPIDVTVPHVQRWRIVNAAKEEIARGTYSQVCAAWKELQCAVGADSLEYELIIGHGRDAYTHWERTGLLPASTLDE